MVLPLRPNVCILLINQDNLLFLGERYQESGHWQFPQGGCEPDFSEESNVLRELNEELGAPPESFDIIKKLQARYDYDWKSPPAYAIGKWRGQSQSFWLVRFSGQDSDIDLNAHEPEFMNWRWCTVEQVKKLAFSRRLKGYLPALEEFKAWLQAQA